MPRSRGEPESASCDLGGCPSRCTHWAGPTNGRFSPGAEAALGLAALGLARFLGACGRSQGGNRLWILWPRLGSSGLWGGGRAAAVSSTSRVLQDRALRSEAGAHFLPLFLRPGVGAPSVRPGALPNCASWSLFSVLSCPVPGLSSPLDGELLGVRTMCGSVARHRGTSSRTETLPVQTRGPAGVHRLSDRGRQSHIPQEIGILCPERPEVKERREPGPCSVTIPQHRGSSFTLM